MSLFVTFEGGEGSGKTTQIKLLKEKIEKMGFNPFLTREPGGTPISEQIREIILNKQNTCLVPLAELLLYEASRAQHVQEKILPILKENQKNVILCDRFFDATTAYQACARSLGNDLVENLNKIATSNLSPDLTIYIDIDPEVGIKRAKKVLKDSCSNEGRFEEESLEFHRNVRKAYLDIAKNDPQRVKIVDGSFHVEKVHEEIWEHLKCCLKK
jgi:dTMP kinase